MKKVNRRNEALEQQVVMIKQEEPIISPTLGLDFGYDDDPRAIWLTTEIYPDTVMSVVQQIYNINYKDAKKEKEYASEGNVYIRQPIKLHVSSYGGSVYDGFSLIGAIISSKTPVHTYAVGKVMSMGFMIAISGHKRYSYPHTSYMFHSISDHAWGKFSELVESVEEDRRLQHKVDTLVTTRTKITQERLDDVHSRKLDWYFDAIDALELDVVDEII